MKIKVAHYRNLRDRTLRKRYNFTLEEYEKMLSAQNGKCACCKSDGALMNKRHKNLYVDHCHLSGKVRGIVCDECNKAIGFLRDSVANALDLAAYLHRTHSIESFVEVDILVRPDTRKFLESVIKSNWKRPVQTKVEI